MEDSRKRLRMGLFHAAQRIRVPAGFVMIPLMLIAARPSLKSTVCGGALALVGITIRAWASGYLHKNEVLATTGPYAYSRNPLYLGTLILGFGVAISTASTWFVLLFTVVYLAVYLPVMIAEADTLIKLFPREYSDYSAAVPLLFPRLIPRLSAPQPATASNPPAGGTFDLRLYMKHREYRALLGFAAAIAALVMKALLVAR